ncbi:MAG TPA: methyl-accepting chemotaxis protein [Caulobacteraceae bacterium]|jgi:methyl-accepting chemotaxis protein
MSVNDYSVSKKLTLGFAIVVTVVLAMCGVLFASLSDVTHDSKLNDDSYDCVDRLDQAKADVWREGWALNKFALTGDEQYASQADAANDAFHKTIDEARSFDHGAPDVDAAIQAVGASGDSYYQQVVQPGLSGLRNPATHDAAVVSVKSPEGGQHLTEFASAVDSALATTNKWSDQWTGEENDSIGASHLALLIGGALTVALSGLMGWLLSRGIASPVSQMTGAMNRLANGDNAVAIPAVGRKDEIGQMAGAVQTFKDAAIEKIRLEAEAAEQRRAAEVAREAAEAERAETARLQSQVVTGLALGLEKLTGCVLTYRIDNAFAPEYEKLRADFNSAMQQLQTSMQVVAANTAEIRSGAGEITQASDDLSKRTEQQAASLEETAAALDQITATVTKTAQGARDARDVVAAAKGDAEHSGSVVRDAVKAMSQIETSSQQISQIIGVIDEIAFQTNLLALNAGVEAARAGDAGKGFAVVASEVRALAQRSAEAAKEIKTLISASSQQVGRGVTLVGETGEVLERIVTQVTQINQVVSEIAASAQEQASGLAQVNTAVNQMDQVTQQNAAMVEQSTAASHALAQETNELSRLIARFELGDAETGVTERPAAKRSAHKTEKPARAVAALKTVSQRQPAPGLEPEWSEF